ncbi:restriction endonuclease [Streptomyces collinus]|uniref:restriction endonuclease n=1 Tax=Streptomyces collinus TaxID=42684 RepID=UPI0036857FD3
MFEEDGSLDPLLKFLLHAVIALAVGKMLWEWLTEDVGQWITVDLWGLIAHHPWWTGLFAVGGLPMLLLLGGILSFLFAANTYADSDDTFAAPSGDAIEADALTFKMKQLSSMRVGGAGDLGVDVTARDDEDRLLIVQRKQYQSPVGSGLVQKFTGTAPPHHGADLPIMIALNGFTQPAMDFARHHQLILMSARS